MKETVSFIGNWILTTSEEKTKAYFDVWEIVLSNYLPSERPLLFRACKRITKNGKIASFTGKLDSARNFSKGEGFLMICDTKEIVELDNANEQGNYKYTFYPISSLLEKAKQAGGCGFSKRILEYICEGEYIMRVDLKYMECFKWIQK